jgi:hypothetical protein
LQLLQLVLSEQSVQLAPQLGQDERVELIYLPAGQTKVLVEERMKGKLQLVQVLAPEHS